MQQTRQTSQPVPATIQGQPHKGRGRISGASVTCASAGCSLGAL